MSVIAIANQAGSVGKTTTAVTLASLLAAEGRTVRVIDFDGQANASQWLGCAEPAATIVDVMMRRCDGLDQATVTTNVDGVQLVPADGGVDSLALELARVPVGESRLRTALRDASPVDVTLIDCPGAPDVRTVSALMAVRLDDPSAIGGVVTVFQPSLKEVEGIPKLERTIADVAEAYNDRLGLSAAVPCIVPPSNAGALYKDVVDLAVESYNGLVSPPVRRAVAVAEAYARRTPLPEYVPDEPVTEDYRAVLKHCTDQGLW